MKNPFTNSPAREGRPLHQLERGPRYGNNRKLASRLKKKDRRAGKRKDEQEWKKMFVQNADSN